MGAAESTEKLGQRVVIAKGKLTRDLQSAQQHYEYLLKNSPQTLATMLESVSDSFSTCSPFLEPTLLVVWLSDAPKCKEITLNACKKVLRAPIKEDEYEWFRQYVFPSNIWMLKTNGRFMYEELFDIGNALSHSIVSVMDSIHDHLQSHKQWNKVMAIPNQSIIARQDHERVGLLQEHGLKNVFEAKLDDEQSNVMKTFIDSNMAINMLTSTASKLNGDFQRHIKMVMSSHGHFKEAPMKKVERSLSKVENDYKFEAFPKAAKLLDLVRCSVTFNTVEQLIAGYDAFLNHIKSNPTIMALARVKNGFINSDEQSGGYRDIKINLVYRSQNPEHKNVRMICEVQLLLINYLEEKKKIHKLYSILREETFFRRVVAQNADVRAKKHLTELRFEQVLNVGQEVPIHNYNGQYLSKCSVDSELGLLGMEGDNWFGCCNMRTKKMVWSLRRSTLSSYGASANDSFGAQTHEWVTIKRQKYLSLQTGRNKIKMFKVGRNRKNEHHFVQDKKYELVHSSDEGIICFCEFDQNFEHIFLITDHCVLQKRAVHDINTVMLSIQLKERVNTSTCRNFRLSADGKYCVLGGGLNQPYFYVIDIENRKQQKLDSSVLTSTYVPCFINGENRFVAVSDRNGNVEIWDIEQEKAIKNFQIASKSGISSSTSTHNILAIGSWDKTLRLYDVRDWNCFYQARFECDGESLHLTDDLKYVTFAGQDEKLKDRCVVLEIN